jgi:hypothetical protein
MKHDALESVVQTKQTSSAVSKDTEWDAIEAWIYADKEFLASIDAARMDPSLLIELDRSSYPRD